MADGSGSQEVKYLDEENIKNLRQVLQENFNPTKKTNIPIQRLTIGKSAPEDEFPEDIDVKKSTDLTDKELLEEYRTLKAFSGGFESEIPRIIPHYLNVDTQTRRGRNTYDILLNQYESSSREKTDLLRRTQETLEDLKKNEPLTKTEKKNLNDFASLFYNFFTDNPHLQRKFYFEEFKKDPEKAILEIIDNKQPGIVEKIENLFEDYSSKMINLKNKPFYGALLKLVDTMVRNETSVKLNRLRRLVREYYKRNIFPS